jgi:hypothetical protein
MTQFHFEETEAREAGVGRFLASNLSTWAHEAMGWDDPGWKQAACEYHAMRGSARAIVELERDKLLQLRRLIDPEVSLEQAWYELNAARVHGRAPESVVEALMFSLRAGVGALNQPEMQRRLSELSDAQLR